MAQAYNDVPATDTLAASRGKLLDRDDALKSNFSGAAFPTTGLLVGMTCFRTDLNKLYMLRDTTPTWLEIANVAGSANLAVNSDMVDGYHADPGTAGNTVPVRNAGGQVPGSITGNAATASALATARNLSVSGDATGSASFDGSANAAISLTLASTPVTPGTYNAANITVDAKGRITGASGNPTIVASFNGRAGAVSLTSGDVTGALGYTPANAAGATFTGNVWVQNARLRVWEGNGASSTIEMVDDESTNGIKYIYAHGNWIGFLGGNFNWIFYARQDGWIGSPAYGWLHDYFFSAVSNSGGSIGSHPGPFGTLDLVDASLVDNGGTISLVRTYRTFACDCGTACDCTCVPAGTLVRMADGCERPIESIHIGDELWGGGKVVNLRSPYLGHRALWEINGRLQITGDHLIRTKRIGWACVEPDLVAIRAKHGIAPAVAFTDLRIGDEVLTCDGWVEVISIQQVPALESLQLHTLYVEGTGAFFAEGFCIDGILTPQEWVLPAIEEISA
jgi:hypothetical protein